MSKKWWKEVVVYQIYPRSFKDSNGDGIGDIQGIIDKLDYLKELGIDVIWINPIYPSPNDDNGYDISDYQAISSEFGTMKDFDQLLEAVHKKQMKMIMDLVINHTSDEHPWFIESRSRKSSPYRNYYIWHPEKNGGEPNNWESIFGGSAWQYDKKSGEYYLHIFSKKQPDLNWENPNVRKHLYEMVNWWLDKGIDGFRIDAISHIKKAKGFPNLPNPKKQQYVPSFDGHMNQPGIDTFLSEFVSKTICNYDVMTVGEANGVKVEDADQWVGEEDGYFNMIFQFDHLDLWGKSTAGKLDIEKLKEVLTKWQKGLERIGWNALFLENHDQPRSVSTWGNDKQLRKTSAKALATLYFLMQGTPFIYQGQEIGMTNVKFENIDHYNDVAIKNLYNQERKAGKSHKEVMKVIWKNGRDNARTPMQWSSEEHAGFTKGHPWLKVNSNYADINVKENLADPNSIYHYYKKLINLRKSSETLVYGKYDLILEKHPYVYGYTRSDQNEQFLILVNLFNKQTRIQLDQAFINKKFELVLSNYGVCKTIDSVLNFRPYEARVYQVK
ncbi:Oligo-1,6-glucosidase [Paraliobacillus sp. PM-2]|uniref:glycoside hydrolase family 13 protein n=1 Tax=Paraliobacillus sp. PM-2 TaxID=1462524 RepID=UPI00061BEE6B|nr:alpha-glucosidase [Paraliobacillus sp. PM-2]CQR47907.1 Oligo-1,6-glucosidase [Paraliobacillus sp. PM-2]